jgi:hypothetical protein
MAKPIPKPKPAPPKGNLWFLVGSPLLGLANNIFVQKYGGSIPDYVTYAIYAIAIACLVIGVFRLEEFVRSGGKLKQYAKDHRFSLAIVGSLLLAFAVNAATVLVSRAQQKDRSEQTVKSTSGAVTRVTQPTASTPTKSPDPCPDGGRTIINGATVDASKLGPGAKSTGFFFKGNPCVTVTDSKAIGTTEGYKFDASKSTSQKKAAVPPTAPRQ